MDKSALPSWIAGSLAEIEAKLSERSRRHFNSFVKAHALLTSTLGELSPRAKILEIKDTSPQYLEEKFGDAKKGLALCVESFISQWAYQNFYKIMSWANGLLKALEDGNFLLAASCSRGLFEQTCHFDFYLGRLDRVTQETIKLWQNEGKNILKGRVPGKEWHVSYVKSQLEVIKYTLKAMRGSDYDWNAWFSEALRSAEIPTDGPDQLLHESDRKTHINSCIEAVEKRHKINIAKYYDILCDLVHPNFGSNTLVVLTREDLGDQLGNVELSYAPKNAEAAAWFFEVIAEPMHEIMEIAVKDMRLANRTMRFFQEQATSLAGFPRESVN